MKLWRTTAGAAAVVAASSLSSCGRAEEGSSVSSTTNSSSVLLHYCSSLSFQEAPECYIHNAEILPNLQLPGSTVFHSVTSAADCQERCHQTDGCAYFTFRTDTTTDENVCILKPHPSLATSPIIALRAFEAASTSRYTYVSGPRECDQDCVEDVELISGCGASAPGSCTQLPRSAVFDAECLNTTTDDNCNVQGFRCCKQQPEGCSARLSGYRLSGGVALQSWPLGIFTQEHCWASCVATTGCTHWNYIQSFATSFVGGACFLYAYEDPTSPSLVAAASFETSLIGGVTCDGDFGLDAPPLDGSSTQSPSGVETTTTTTTHPPLNGTPVDGTCFSEGLDIHEGFLYTKWGVYSHTECQELCQIWPGCRAFAFGASQNVCHLKYTWEGLTEVADSSASNFYVVGPRDCPGVAAAPAVEGCISPDFDIESEDLVHTETASGAAHCGLMCVWQDCVGWSFFEGVCYIKNTAEPMVERPGVASGVGGCVWPDYERRERRSLTATEASVILPSTQISACALNNKDIDTHELETIGSVDSLESCHVLCLERLDCFYSVYFAADQLCRIKYEGNIIDKFGSTVIPRACGGWCTEPNCSHFSANAAAATTHTTFNGHSVKSSSSVPAGEAVRGLSTRYLGHPSEWVVKGSIPDFGDARNWARVALLVLTDDDENDCFVSDLLHTVNTCWEAASEVLPLSIHFQIIGVAAHANFKGWENISWEQSTVDTSVSDGHFEFVNVVVTITAETDYLTGGHGVALFEVAGADPQNSLLLLSSWPKDLSSPINFSAGKFYARAQVLGERAVASRIMFCVTGKDDPLAEICTIPITIPPSLPPTGDSEHHHTEERNEETHEPENEGIHHQGEEQVGHHEEVSEGHHQEHEVEGQHQGEVVGHHEEVVGHREEVAEGHPVVVTPPQHEDDQRVPHSPDYVIEHDEGYGDETSSEHHQQEETVADGGAGHEQHDPTHNDDHVHHASDYQDNAKQDYHQVNEAPAYHHYQEEAAAENSSHHIHHEYPQEEEVHSSYVDHEYEAPSSGHGSSDVVVGSYGAESSVIQGVVEQHREQQQHREEQPQQEGQHQQVEQAEQQEQSHQVDHDNQHGRYAAEGH